jgi:hypothetical protein
MVELKGRETLGDPGNLSELFAFVVMYKQIRILQLTARSLRQMVAFCAASGVRLQRDGEIADFPASRNPGGVYSDAGGGAQYWEYQIEL